MDGEQETELRNPFPSPPSHYQQYTIHNLQLLTLLKERTEQEGEEQDQSVVLADQKDVPDWPLRQLEKPRVDWILEEGYYNVFGDTWFVGWLRLNVAKMMFLLHMLNLGKREDPFSR